MAGVGTVAETQEEGARPPGYRLMLREMAPDERPREKLKLRGPSALSDGDLLAIILNTGVEWYTIPRRRLPAAACAPPSGGS